MFYFIEEKDIKERIQELIRYRKHGITKLDGMSFMLLEHFMIKFISTILHDVLAHVTKLRMKGF